MAVAVELEVAALAANEPVDSALAVLDAEHPDLAETRGTIHHLDLDADDVGERRAHGQAGGLHPQRLFLGPAAQDRGNRGRVVHVLDRTLRCHPNEGARGPAGRDAVDHPPLGNLAYMGLPPSVFEPGTARVVRIGDALVHIGSSTEGGAMVLDRFFGALVRPDNAPMPYAAAGSHGGPTIVIDDANHPVAGDDPFLDSQLTIRAVGADRVAHHELGGSAQLVGTRLHVGLSSDIDDPWRVGRHLVAWGFQLMWNRLGTPVIHGALVSQADGALIVLGASGAGKSTLAIAALTSGWTVHGDDVTVLSTAAGDIAATTVPRRVMVAEELVPALADFVVVPVSGDHRGRSFVPDAATPVADGGWLPLRGIVEVGHHDAEGALEPGSLATLDVAMALGDAHDPGVMRANLGVAAALVGLPTWRLLHAVDHDARISRAQELLAEAWRRCEVAAD